MRAEYPVAVERLKIAIRQATELGLLGENTLESRSSFNLEIKLGAGAFVCGEETKTTFEQEKFMTGAGAFVCGEETALIASIEGHRGEPYIRPPFPAAKGLFGKPTLLNNVETYATIPQIILNGPEWASSIGTENSKGTKVFALGGKIKNIGLVEVPMDWLKFRWTG